MFWEITTARESNFPHYSTSHIWFIYNEMYLHTTLEPQSNQQNYLALIFPKNFRINSAKKKTTGKVYAS